MRLNTVITDSHIADSAGKDTKVDTLNFNDINGNVAMSVVKKGDGTYAMSCPASVFDTLTDAAIVAWAFNGAESRNASVTLGGNRTLSISGATNGASGTIAVTQDGTGSRTLTLPAGSKVIAGGTGAATLTTTAGATDILSFVYDGTNYFWTVGLNFT